MLRAFAFLALLTLTACSASPKHPAVFARDECKVEPQPLSCAGAADSNVMRAP